ncbi:hypothetical protein [Bifidobacterium simiarum]|uniref:hypothetical protein n=1 Tax=Bifidobacterium simiarum TaxID=2045441 RepID=UPI001BDCB56A|nr:hypothetical protein [Bifidobacterium simiarum]MBT1166795.1 hypothetical protein [Bifidobacterium simiarum]
MTRNNGTRMQDPTADRRRAEASALNVLLAFTLGCGWLASTLHDNGFGAADMAVAPIAATTATPVAMWLIINRHFHERVPRGVTPDCQADDETMGRRLRDRGIGGLWEWAACLIAYLLWRLAVTSEASVPAMLFRVAGAAGVGVCVQRAANRIMNPVSGDRRGGTR